MSISSPSRTTEYLIDRPALVAALDGAFDRRLTLIAAQAGAGKTTLLRQWVAAHTDKRFIRLDIDDADDDPAFFTRRLIAALAVTRPAVAGVSGGIPRNGDGLGSALIVRLATVLVGAPETVILLDDMHRLSNVTLVTDLGRLIERLPRTVHVVIASRVDPPIALSRHRVNDDLLELRPAQLAFSETESAALLERIAGRALEPEQVRVLRDRTEGWAAGLQLAGLRLRQEEDTDSFIAEFGGSDRLVADYLSEEVIARLPSDRRRLLLEMSLLDDMCAELVEAATGSADAQHTLEELEHECMFLVPLDSCRGWYRFHHLFSELLRSRLRAENPAAELRILTAAADWHLSRSRVKSALDYLLRAQARDGAMEAMLSSAADDAANGGGLPQGRGTDHALLRTAQINEDLFAGVRHAWGNDSASIPASPERLPGSVPQRGWGFVAAQVLWRARPDISTDEARRQLAALGRGVQTEVGRPNLVDVLVSGGRAYFLAGNTDEARKWLSRALAGAATDVAGRVSALSALSLVEAWCRNTTRADALVRDALENARSAGMLAHPAIADAYLASVLTAVEPEPSTASTPPPWSPIRIAPTTVLPPKAPPTGLRGPNPPVVVAGRDSHSAEDTSATQDNPRLLPSVLFERAAASITLGDTEPAREIVAAWNDLVQASTPLSIVQNHILRARLAAVDQSADEALRELTSALKVAEIHGLVDVFIQAGPLILQRLSMISGPEAVFSDLIRARAEMRTGTASPSSVDDIAEPLTDRELEILAYLPTRLTNVELARRFFVSVNTIKTHMAHIYRKLDATTRDNAIERARELGLL